MDIFEEVMNEVALGNEQVGFEWEAGFGPRGCAFFPPNGPTCFPPID